MKEWKRSLLLLVCTLLLMPTRALAYDKLEIEIPVSTNEPCRIELSGDDTEERIIDGSGAFTVTADHPGTYHYQVRQISGGEKDKVYDERIYDVTVFVETDGGE